MSSLFLPWKARGRTPEQRQIHIPFRCEHCGRAQYMTDRGGEDFGQGFCRGCDEKTAQCYCPEIREHA